ncbi:DNA polymerase IV [Taibaiella lutea]|uniref:DNA polymerase IV n=1 Tax=Taibaiella lutea TaxID=2608001 RepID=A0A5M6CMD6_9BACT|nr:DNA polymerase IV [Taibaiella lutea]KAA5535142.1 DNA polymerase IV [Taibaiella lutea]
MNPGPVPPYRKIIHIDMDAFYASVEQRDFPEYRNKPIIVGGLPDRRGVVATASYEARKFGVRSAMSSVKAQQLCPEGIFVFPRFDAYKQVSQNIRAIFRRYTDVIEPLSLDEAYLDVTQDKLGIGSAITIAEEIRQSIKSELQLTASAGVSVNKFIAKIASDMNKPDGLTFIGPSQILTFMEQLPVEKFFGVGKVTAQKMKSMQLFTGADLKQLSETEMIRHFGKTGKFYYNMVRGIDERPVQSQRTIKSIAAEDTFEKDLELEEDMISELEKLAQKVTSRLEKHALKAKTITLKVKFSDFKQITRNFTFPQLKSDYESLFQSTCFLLSKLDFSGKKVRLLGISVSNFENETPKNDKGNNFQLSLF